MTAARVRVELYGRLKDAGLGDFVELELPGSARAEELLDLLARRLGGCAALLAGAALATDTEILARSALVPAGRRLAALPPVCGG